MQVAKQLPVISLLSNDGVFTSVQASTRRRSLSAPRTRKALVEEDVTFRPKITKMAKNMQPRSVEQLSEGDR